MQIFIISNFFCKIHYKRDIKGFLHLVCFFLAKLNCKIANMAKTINIKHRSSIIFRFADIDIIILKSILKSRITYEITRFY